MSHVAAKSLQDNAGQRRTTQDNAGQRRTTQDNAGQVAEWLKAPASKHDASPPPAAPARAAVVVGGLASRGRPSRWARSASTGRPSRPPQPAWPDFPRIRRFRGRRAPSRHHRRVGRGRRAQRQVSGIAQSRAPSSREANRCMKRRMGDKANPWVAQVPARRCHVRAGVSSSGGPWAPAGGTSTLGTGHAAPLYTHHPIARVALRFCASGPAPRARRETCGACLANPR